MAEEKQVGIPQEPVDYSSDLLTKPYDLDLNKKYDDTKTEVISGDIKRTVVGDNTKLNIDSNLQRQPQVVQFLAGLERFGRDFWDTTIPKETIKWRTDPMGAAQGWLLGGIGATKGATLAGKAATSALGKTATTAVGKGLTWGSKAAGAVGGGFLVPVAASLLTSGGFDTNDTQLMKDSYSFLAKQAQKQYEKDFKAGKITQQEFDSKIAEVQSYLDTVDTQVDTFYKAREELDGTPYPTEKIADVAVQGAAEYLLARDEFENLWEQRQGIDPETTGYKIGNMGGFVGLMIGSSYLGNKIGRYGWKGSLKRLGTDVEAQGGAERLASIKPIRSNKQAANIAEQTVKLFTAEIEGTEYVWKNAQDYIERTGDKTLSGFTAKDANGLMAQAYGAIAGEIEVLGGIENIATGAFRRLGVGRMGAMIVETGGGEGGEEFIQQLSEFLSRKIDGTTDKTWGDALSEALNSAAWGAFMGIGFGTVGGVAYRNAKKQGVKVLQEYGLSRETAEKVFDNMVDQVADANTPQNETVRDNIREKVSTIYENADLSPAEMEDTVEAITDLEMAFIAQDSAERGIDIADNPILQGEVNQIGWFREGIPEQVSDQVRTLNDEIAGLRQQLREESAKETKDFNKIADLEAKIEQFYAKLPKEISDLVETDRAKIRQMLSEQMARARDLQDRRKVVRQVQQRALKALQREQESDVQKSLRRLQEQTKTEEQKAREAERKQWQDQRKLRKAIEKLRHSLIVRRGREQGIQALDLDADLVIDILHKAGITDSQITQMKVAELDKTIQDTIWNKVFKPTKKEIAEIKAKADKIIESLKKAGLNVRRRNNVSDDGSVYFIVDYGKNQDVFRLGVTRTGKTHNQAYTANININATPEEVLALVKQYKGGRKTKAHELVGGEVLYQQKTTGKGGEVRGFFVPEWRLISLTQNADPTSLAHELAHDWMQQFFRHYRSGKASDSFMKSWGAVEKALGITENDITVPDKASEAFARAYEAWVMNKPDWAKNLNIEDKDHDKMLEIFKRYQGYLTDVYEDLNNPYFLETWGETGKLKPELQAWFDKVTNTKDLIEAQVQAGKITPEQAKTKTITKKVNEVVQAAEDNFTQEEKDEISAVERINDTNRYEVPGGNKNSLQNRLSGLARDIDANDVALGRYNAHRDMLEVAKAADDFVRTRRDEALNIINGIEPEKEGLFASDLYTALERVALETNDVDLALELINSKVAQDLAKEWGQRIAGFRNFTGDGNFDGISQLKSLDNKFKKDYDEKGKERVGTAADEYVEELNKADDSQDVDTFLDSIKCQ